MAESDDLISWAIINSPAPREDERPRPTPLFDAFSSHMRAIAERVVGERASETLPIRLEGWGWDVYAQQFQATTTVALPGPETDDTVVATGKFWLDLEAPNEWRSAFAGFGQELDAYIDQLARLRAALDAGA